MVSFDPASMAVSDPDPVTLALIATSIATGASRVRNVSDACPVVQSPKLIPIARATYRCCMLFPSGQMKNSTTKVPRLNGAGSGAREGRDVKVKRARKRLVQRNDL